MRIALENKEECIRDFLKDYSSLDKSCLDIRTVNNTVSIKLKGDIKRTTYAKSITTGKFYKIK